MHRGVGSGAVGEGGGEAVNKDHSRKARKLQLQCKGVGHWSNSDSGRSRAAQAPHVCPYREEIHEDSTTLCNCCESCTYECAMDI